MRIRFGDFLKRLIKRDKEASGNGGASAVGVRFGSVAPWLYSTSPALCVGAAYRCISLLSTSVANLPVRCKKLKGRIYVDDNRSNLPYLLNIEPDPSMNSFDFWRQVVIEVVCYGNAYIVPFYSTTSGDWNRLALCGRGTVSHDTVNDIYTVNDFENGVFGTFDESRIIHIKGMTGANPKSGVSVLTYARLTTSIANAGDEEALDRFKNGGTVKGILSNFKGSTRGFGELQDKELRNLAAEVDVDFSSGENIIGLPGDVDFKQISLSSADMQFLESRKFTVREICRFFGVHPSFVFDDTSNNYKSAEMANVAFLSNTLNPMLRQIEIELLRKLYPRSLCMMRKIEFDRQGLYACDLDSRVKYLGAMIAAGLYTVNEARALEDRPPVECGDKVLVSANLKGLEDLTAGGNQEVNKPIEENNGNEETD